MPLGMGDGRDWVGRNLRAKGASHADREARPEYHSRSYNVSFRSALIVVLLFVAILVGV